MKNENGYSLMRKATISLALLIPMAASAHPGVPGHTHGFGAGAIHPFTGFDHLLAMMAVGIFAAQRGGKALWQIPLTFVALMAVGGILGAAGIGQVPLIEQLIAASVLLLGIFIATAAQTSLKAILPLIGLFAIFHGYAHGAEMPVASGLSYGIGFLAATAILHLLGIGIGMAAQKMTSAKMLRYIGCAIAVCGICLIFTA